jgi:hypothetical protein
VEEWRSAAPVAKKGRLKSPLEAKVLPLLLRRDLPAPNLNAPVQIANGRLEVENEAEAIADTIASRLTP